LFNSTFTQLLSIKQGPITNNCKVDDETNHGIAEVVTNWLPSGVLNYINDGNNNESWIIWLLSVV